MRHACFGDVPCAALAAPDSKKSCVRWSKKSAVVKELTCYTVGCSVCGVGCIKAHCRGAVVTYVPGADHT